MCVDCVHVAVHVFRRLCTNAIWCNYVRRMCVDYVQVAVPMFGRLCTNVI
jgi:hypothetical protein